MAKGKYHQWLTNEGLILLEGWARDGLTDEQIAKNMGINPKTLYDWMKKYSKICKALKKGKEVVDLEVENALLKRALGYEFAEKKYVQVEMSDEEYYLTQKMAVNKYKLEHPEATIEDIRLVEIGVSRYKMALLEEKIKDIAPDVTAQIFWLKNRRPDKWRDKQDIEHSGGMTNTLDLSGLSVEELRKLAKDSDN